MCWVGAFLTCPPCAWRDLGCWESFDDYYEISDNYDEDDVREFMDNDDSF